jgi:transposase
MFVGWDWASTTHDVTVLDDAGMVVDRWAFRHTEQDLGGALDRLARLAEPAMLPVIIERASGLVVERLLAAGHPVVPVHPTAFWAARPRWGASGAKSDPGDSYKLADYLRTDGHRLRRLGPPDARLQELQALVRLREDHLRARTAASNQLGALLDAHWPGPKAVFYRLASPIALAFLTDYPTPQAAARLGQARMASFCRRHSYRGGKTPAQLLARLHSAPTARSASRPPPWQSLSAPRSNSCEPCLGPSPSSKRRSPPASLPVPAPNCSRRCPASAPSTSPNCSPRWARSWTGSAAPSRPPPNAALRRSLEPPARPGGSTSAGPPTGGPARP